MKPSHRLLLSACVLLLLLPLLPLSALAVPAEEVSATALSREITQTGDIPLSLTPEELEARGYSIGDLVVVTAGGRSVPLPFCNAATDVEAGESALIPRNGKLCLTVRQGSFAETWGIAEVRGGTWVWLNDGHDPLPVAITMDTPGGYYLQYILHQLFYTNRRSDYPDLTDEAFANFRPVTTNGMGANRLYRTSSPVNPAIGRASYADEALRQAEVSVILNLADRPEMVPAYAGFDRSYYSQTHYAPLSIDMDFSHEGFRMTLVRGLRFLAENPGVYAIHCTEGKDRTGIVVALLECLMGATAEEVEADYMATFTNYYGMTPEDPRYQVILDGGIRQSLCSFFGLETLQGADLSAAAETYLIKIGMSPSEISVLKENLGKDRDLDQGMGFVDVEADAWYAQGVEAVARAGWMTGTSPTTFDPNGSLTRAQLVTILWRMEGSPQSEAGMPFTDVPGDAWYTEAVRWAAEVNLVMGVDATHFAPMADITREQLATILYRSIGGAERAAEDHLAADYVDRDEVSPWAYDALCWMTNHGIITGMDGNRLAPKAGASRAQMAVMLNRLKEAL